MWRAIFNRSCRHRHVGAGLSVEAARTLVCNDSLALNQSCHWNTTAELNATNAPLFWCDSFRCGSSCPEP